MQLLLEYERRIMESDTVTTDELGDFVRAMNDWMLKNAVRYC